MLFVLKALSFVLGHMPRSLAISLGSALGSLASKLDKKRTGIAVENIRRAFPAMSAKEAHALAAEAFENLGVMLFEFMRIPWLDAASMKRFVDVEGFENFQRALAKNKGVIVLTGHLGNWEMMGAALGHLVHPLDIVARDLDNPAMDEFVSWARRRAGNRLVPKNRTMRRLLRSLAENGVVAVLLDQNVTRSEGVFVDFFGTPACTNKGPALLASVSGAAVVPIFNVREGKRYRIRILEEVEMADTGDREKDAATNTQRCTKVIEEAVRKSPGQWFWVHRRWKTRPLNEKNP